MANEISITASISALKASTMSNAVAKSVTNLLRNMTGSPYVENSISLPTSATAIPLGSVTGPHWAFFMNLDSTNYLTLFNGASGAVFLRLLAGDFAICPLDPTCVPYGQSNTAACQLDYLILSA